MAAVLLAQQTGLILHTTTIWPGYRRTWRIASQYCVGSVGKIRGGFGYIVHFG